MLKLTVLVTGSGGQLGLSLQKIAPAYPDLEFIFFSHADMPLDNAAQLKHIFESVKPHFCINCAAYTAVDKAETEQEQAFLINAEAVGVLAGLCKTYQTKFLHISTDYVFNGFSAIAYKEDATIDPLNVYGVSKAKGEELALRYNADAIIIRTSWVYSEFGRNFVKTMIQLMDQRNELNVVSDQVGSPTYAVDLAGAILKIVNDSQWVPGIFHYCNEGKISWYAFAVAIKEITVSNCVIHPIPTASYPTPAKRPAFSLLDTSKIVSIYGITIPYWKESLETCINNYRSARN